MKITPKKVYCLLVFLLFSFVAFSQVTEIKGKVIDATTKEVLSYANLRLKGTLTATTSDLDGFYHIRTAEKSDSLIVSYLGYPTKSIAILKGKSQEIDVEMGSNSIEIKEVVVKKKRGKRVIDTTANYVYYKVLNNKANNRENNLQSFKLEEYTKMQMGLLNAKKGLINFFLFKPFRFVFDNVDTLENQDTYIRGIMKEDIADVYYKKNPKGIKRVTKATRITGIDNPSIGNLANYNFDKIDAYDNIYILLGKSFLSPFSPGALGTYIYFVTDTQFIENRRSYKIHFVGKSKVDLALKGYAWIDSATWAIKSIDFRPNERTNMNFIKNYSIAQKYTLLDSTNWILQGENMQAEGAILKTKKRQTTILIQKEYLRKNIAYNIPLPDTLFNKIEIEFIEDSARNKSRAWWEENRYIPLNQFEKKIIQLHDTIPKVRAYKTYMWFGKLLASAYLDFGKVDAGRFYTFLSRNNIEGWRVKLGGKTNFKMSRTWNLNGYVAYGFKDKDVKYMADFITLLPSQRERWRTLEINYRYDMTVLGQENTLLTFDNFITIFRGKPLTKIMKTREWNVVVENEWLKGFSSLISLNQKEFYRIPGIFDFNQIQPDGSVVSIPKFSVFEFGIDNRISLRTNYLRMGWYRFFTNTKYPAFTFKYNLGNLTMNGLNYPYQKFYFSIKHRLSWAAGYTKYEIRAGAIVGAAPYPISYVTSSGFGVFFDTKNFNMLSEFEFVTDKYLQVFLEHHFDGFFFNKIPYFNRLQLREVLYCRALWGDYSNKNKQYLVPLAGVKSPFPIPYVEAGFAIDNILKLFRVDFIWRCTYRDQSLAPNFAVKFTLSPHF